MLKITLISYDLIGPKMAGPGIRYLELARVLGKDYAVALLAPEGSCSVEGPFQFITYRKNHLIQSLPSCDLILTQEITARLVLYAKKNSIKIIYDAYDPLPLEYLEIFKSASFAFREYKNREIIEKVMFAIKQSDGLICASRKQRDLWMGTQLAAGKITPFSYDSDPSFNNSLSIIPFGLPSTIAVKTGPGFREKFHFGKEDPLLIWGGGIWNWFDPLTLIEAMPLILSKMPAARLVFMGVKHPNPDIPEMQMAHQAIELAKKLQILDKNVFFNRDWIPYEERANYLLEATIGVSMHFEHLETQYSFRTRILDYLWTNLPMIATKGDYFSDLIEEKKLGYTVPAKDSKAIAEAFFKSMDKENYAKIKSNINNVAAAFTWEKQAEPLRRMLPFLCQNEVSKMAWKDNYALWNHYLRHDFPREIYSRLKQILPARFLHRVKKKLGYGA